MRAIQPIVEGHGEVTAVPELLRRLLHDGDIYDVSIGRPHRKHKSDFLNEQKLKAAIRVARAEASCSAILVLFDADTLCPKEHHSRITEWCRDASSGVPCEVVIAKHEYEAWLIAAMESLRGLGGIAPDAVSHAAPENLRGAKGYIEQFLPRHGSYKETQDQVALSARFDMAAAHAKCRSFRRLVKALGALLVAIGASPAAWPPRSCATVK